MPSEEEGRDVKYVIPRPCRRVVYISSFWLGSTYEGAMGEDQGLSGPK